MYSGPTKPRQKLPSGMSLLEVMVVLTILALASSVILFRYSPNPSDQQWLQLEQLLQTSRDQSFYQQSTLRLSCNSHGLQQQRLQPSDLRHIPGHGKRNAHWVDTDFSLELESKVCLYKSAGSDCIPCPYSDTGLNSTAKHFEIIFSDGLATQSYKLLGLRDDDSNAAPIDNRGLDIYAHGMIKLTEALD